MMYSQCGWMIVRKGKNQTRVRCRREAIILQVVFADPSGKLPEHRRGLCGLHGQDPEWIKSPKERSARQGGFVALWLLVVASIAIAGYWMGKQDDSLEPTGISGLPDTAGPFAAKG